MDEGNEENDGAGSIALSDSYSKQSGNMELGVSQIESVLEIGDERE